MILFEMLLESEMEINTHTHTHKRLLKSVHGKFLRDMGGSSVLDVPLLRELSSFRRFDMMMAM